MGVSIPQLPGRCPRSGIGGTSRGGGLVNSKVCRPWKGMMMMMMMMMINIIVITIITFLDFWLLLV